MRRTRNGAGTVLRRNALVPTVGTALLVLGLAGCTDPITEAMVADVEKVPKELAVAGSDCSALAQGLKLLEKRRLAIAEADLGSGARFSDRGDEAVDQIVKALDQLTPRLKRCSSDIAFMAAMEPSP